MAGILTSDMENGATVSVESSWALNMANQREAQTLICGTLAGADFADGLRINYIHNGRQCIEKPDMKAGGVAFFDGDSGDPPHVREARQWIRAVVEDKTPTVLPEQAFVVTQILEGIYTSAKTGTIFNF